MRLLLESVHFFVKSRSMMARNHIPFAMASWWLFAIGTDQPIEAHGTMAAAVGGLLPDLDHPESALGRRVKFISLPLSAIFGHRGMTHSLLAAVGLLLILVAVTTMPAYTVFNGLIAPICIGYLSHLLGDSFTPSGVPLFWPRKRTYSFNIFKTWSWQETAFTALFTFAVILFGGVATSVWQLFNTSQAGALLQAVYSSTW